jgi:predicted DsbA family dithiol-disulfide isomerase
MKIGALFLMAIVLVTHSSCGQSSVAQQTVPLIDTVKTKKIMKVEIWSDVMCPFCYIGKRKFEKALSEFSGKDQVVVEWKSFQLSPDMKTDPSKNTIQHLAESKGWTMDYTKSTINYVVNMAKEVGLNYDFEHAVVANSFDAHRLIQFAKSKGKGDAAEERLFKAYFTEGKNTADHSVLLSIAKEIGLDEAEAKAVLESQQFADQVKHDIAESEQLGVTGVPFFVIDRKYAVSGAQDSQVFLDSLNKAWAQFQR